MKSHLKRNPFLKFLITAVLLYILWYILYELWLHPAGKIDSLVINNSIFLTSKLLTLFGYDVFTSHTETIRTLGIDGTPGLWIGDPCNGLTLFALFTGFIIAYPGTIKKKLIYIPIGIITIHFLNILRISGLCMVVFYSPESLEFNHTYTFTIIVYAYIFLLWMIWVKIFSKAV